MRQDGESHLELVQDMSISGRRRNWKLRTSAREATLIEIANSKLRRLLAQNNTFGCTDPQVGDSFFFYSLTPLKAIGVGAGRESRCA